MNRLIAILLVSIVQANEIAEKACLEIENVDPNEMSAFFQNFTIVMARETENIDQKFKCYIACILEQMNIMDGCSYQLEIAKQYVIQNNQEGFLKPLDACKDSSSGS